MNSKVTTIKNEIPLLIKKVAPICTEYKIDSDSLILEMVKFLNLIHLTGQKISPSYVVDLAWHEFILFTRYYQQYCNENFNRFIHHTPSANEDKNLYKKTLNLYKLHYGKPPQNIWETENNTELNNTNCGACHN